MPFTLAHPAAVLPLRRFCPRFFNFPALVAGSLSPDVGYFFRTLKLDEFSHSLGGSLGFCLPAGVVMLGFFYALRLPVVGMLPERHQKYLRSYCRQPVGSPLSVIVSLLAGIWLHLLLDSFTHKNGWLVINLPVLQTPVFSAGDHTFRIFNLLWYACSFAGIVWVYLAWELWRDRSTGMASSAASRGQWAQAILAGVLMVPMELAHHLISGPAGLFLIAGYGALLIIGVAWRMRSKPSANG